MNPVASVDLNYLALIKNIHFTHPNINSLVFFLRYDPVIFHRNTKSEAHNST